MNRLINFIQAEGKWQYAPLFLILITAGCFYFYRLGAENITLWDEAMHVNVVKNLAQDCCAPKLHRTDIIIDFQDWTNNYIWVHKPLMPLFLQAIFYKVGGGSLFAFRVPGALFALASALALFFMARRHFGYTAALASASLFALNPYVLELVKGRQFSGLHDLMFVFFAILALERLLVITSDPARKNYLWFGLFLGLGYLSKGGLALLFFPALAVVSIIVNNRKQASLNFLYAALLAGTIISLEKILLARLYPAEYFFELGLQVLHLFKDVEYWGRPWDFYVTVYLRDMLLPYLYFPALAGVVWGLSKFKTDPRKLALGLWAGFFIVPLSFGVSKISNFIFAALPSVFLLTTLMVEEFWRKKHNALNLALAITCWLSYIIIRLDLWRIKYHLFQEQELLQRSAILFYEFLIFLALWLIFRTWAKQYNLFKAATVVCWLALFLVLGTYARASQLANNKLPRAYEYQRQVKQAALELKHKYDKTSIFLIDYPGLEKSHLYFQYWSNLEAWEVYDRQPLFVLKKILPETIPVFIVAEQENTRKDLTLIEKNDWGYLYRLNYDNQ